MIGKFTVFKESFNRWPAKNGKPGGESFDLLLLDTSEPRRYALETFYHYRLTPDEKEKFWGKVEGKSVEIGITRIFSGEGRAVFMGEIIAVLDGSKK